MLKNTPKRKTHQNRDFCSKCKIYSELLRVIAKNFKVPENAVLMGKEGLIKEKKCPICQFDEPEKYGHSQACSKYKENI